MDKTTQIFTRDAIRSLQNAQAIFPIIRTQHETAGKEYTESDVLTTEHIFRGSYGFIRETDQFKTFSAVVGFQQAKNLDDYYQTHFHNLIKGRSFAKE